MDLVLDARYPGVVEIVADYEQHCCEDDALAGRPLPDHCE
jgi:hypothetical protein